MKFKVDDCSLVPIPVIHNFAGNIAVLESGLSLPFPIKRIYYLYDVPSGAERGGHAHYELEQYIIAAAGSFSFIIDDGTTRKEVFLNQPDQALYVKPGIWREMKEFSGGSVCLVLASEKYLESDYIRDYADYLNFRNGQ